MNPVLDGPNLRFTGGVVASFMAFVQRDVRARALLDRIRGVAGGAVNARTASAGSGLGKIEMRIRCAATLFGRLRSSVLNPLDAPLFWCYGVSAHGVPKWPA